MIQIEAEDNAYKEKLCAMFCATIKEIGSLLGERADLATAYQKGTDQDQKFISCLAQFLVAFLKDHSALVEVFKMAGCFGNSGDILCIPSVSDDADFKIRI
ncbi:hypothetical protein ANCDUO_24928 [Ancylostoma duodenale]|uniref:Uncharacterized protein n=1 Tax=Ancylostoma duodenale TaxID=51022 RepID=A0A0C2BMK5_9BILA|nr:hypothetical protein ANCDUO_24928 [Ancylostoma duodenale]